MYHERQRLMHCAIHTLNNLFQERWADRGMMDRLALELCDREAVLRSESGMRRMLTNPFKSTIPLIGDYDINVLLEALKIKQCRVSLHAVFNPKNPEAFKLALTEAVSSSPSPRGIIVNYVSQRRLWGAWVNHHFYAIVRAPDNLNADKNISSTTNSGNARCWGLGKIHSGGEGAASTSPARKKSSREVDIGHRGDEGDISGGGGDERTGSGGGGGDGSWGGGEVGNGGGGRDGCGERLAPPVWYSFDSNLGEPRRLGGTRGLLAHLAREVRDNNGHVFVVHDGLERDWCTS
eukprot:jgi/Undpi1/2841/HiC_scaffold_14.g06218.m1